jgi:hypothetical protein
LLFLLNNIKVIVLPNVPHLSGHSDTGQELQSLPCRINLLQSMLALAFIRSRPGLRTPAPSILIPAAPFPLGGQWAASTLCRSPAVFCKTPSCFSITWTTLISLRKANASGDFHTAAQNTELNKFLYLSLAWRVLEDNDFTSVFVP